MQLYSENAIIFTLLAAAFIRVSFYTVLFLPAIYSLDLLFRMSIALCLDNGKDKK